MNISNKIKNTILFLCATSIITFSEISASEKILGEYDGKVIKESDILKEYGTFLKESNQDFAKLDKKTKEDLVRAYVVQKLIDREAKIQKIDSTPEFKKEVENIVKERTARKLIDKQIVEGMSKIDMNDEYEKFKKEFANKEEVKASHILVETKEKAQEVLSALKAKGAKFADIVTKFSKDEGSKSKGGSLGYFSNGQMIPEFEQKAFAMKVGEISEPVKSQFGWHIIKLEDRRPVKMPAKQEAEGMIRDRLSRIIIEKYISDLIQKSNLQIKIED